MYLFTTETLYIGLVTMKPWRLHLELCFRWSLFVHCSYAMLTRHTS